MYTGIRLFHLHLGWKEELKPLSLSSCFSPWTCFDVSHHLDQCLSAFLAQLWWSHLQVLSFQALILTPILASQPKDLCLLQLLIWGFQGLKMVLELLSLDFCFFLCICFDVSHLQCLIASLAQHYLVGLLHYFYFPFFFQFSINTLDIGDVFALKCLMQVMYLSSFLWFTFV